MKIHDSRGNLKKTMRARGLKGFHGRGVWGRLRLHWGLKEDNAPQAT